MRKLRRRIKHFLVPHKGNRYKPGLFAKETIALIALLILLAEGAYFVQSTVVMRNSGFLAVVLPAALTELANQDRLLAGLDALTVDPALAVAAKAKADDMAAKGYFAHTSPEGKSMRDWLSAAGYQYTYAGENLAVDFTESADVERAWMNSPTHRANLLKAEYTRVGYGVAEGMYEGRRVVFVAQYFATTPSDGERSVAAAISPAGAPTPNPEERVLGEEAAPAPTEVQTLPPEEIRYEEPDAAGSVVGKAAALSTSPKGVVTSVLVGITAFIAFFFAIAVFVHVRLRLVQMEMIAGCAIVVGVVITVISYNGASMTHTSLPTASNAASVTAAL
jgi:hypothetical protein